MTSYWVATFKSSDTQVTKPEPEPNRRKQGSRAASRGGMGGLYEEK